MTLFIKKVCVFGILIWVSVCSASSELLTENAPLVKSLREIVDPFLVGDEKSLFDEYKSLDADLSKPLNENKDTLSHLIVKKSPHVFLTVFKDLMGEDLFIQALDYPNKDGVTVFGILLTNWPYEKKDAFPEILTTYLKTGKNVYESMCTKLSDSEETVIEKAKRILLPSSKESVGEYIEETRLKDLLEGLKVLGPLFENPALDKSEVKGLEPFINNPIFPHLFGHRDMAPSSRICSRDQWGDAVNKAWTHLIGRLKEQKGKFSVWGQKPLVIEEAGVWSFKLSSIPYI